MRRFAKTISLLVAAVVYVPLVIDWLMPGNGLHQATIALGGYGPDALRPFSGYFLWDSLVRLIGWDLRGLGTLSMFGALLSLGLVAYIADRIAHGGDSLSTGLVCAAFIATPGFLRAATRPDPLMVLLAVPLVGLALMVRLQMQSGREVESKRNRCRPWSAVCSTLLLAYGLLGCVWLGFSALTEDLVHVLWFVALGVLPHLLWMKRVRRHTVPRRLQALFFGSWIVAIAISATVAARFFTVGRASGHLAERLIASAGGDRAIVADSAFADIYLWTLPADRREAAVASLPVDAGRSASPVGCYLQTADLWHANLAFFVTMDRIEPLWDYCRGLFRSCGDRLGSQLLDVGDFKGAWAVFWAVLNRIDVENVVAILNLCGLIERGYEADSASREFLSRRLLWFLRGLKTPERLTDESAKTLKDVQRTIQAAIVSRLIRPDQIGQKLLDFDLLLGDWESAERDAKSILSIDNRHAQALTVMGKACGRRGEYAESERYLRRALETGRAESSVTGDLAFTLVCMGHAKDAVPLVRSLVRTEPGNWNFRETLALALIRSGDPQEGERELRVAANLARATRVPLQNRIRLAVDRAWFFKVTGDMGKLEQTLRIIKDHKGLEKGIRMEISEIEKSAH